MAKRKKAEAEDRMSLEETWPSEPQYDPNVIPEESVLSSRASDETIEVEVSGEWAGKMPRMVVHESNLELGVSSDGPFIALAQPEAQKRTRKPREVTPIRLAGVAETRIRRLREQSKGRIAMLEAQLRGESEQLESQIARVLAQYPQAVQGVLRALGVIDTSFPALEDAQEDTQEDTQEASETGGA